MREKLRPFLGRRARFTARFDRFGKKDGVRPGESDRRWVHTTLVTVCLTDVRHGTEQVADHIWLPLGQQLSRLELKAGDAIEFHARAEYYDKRFVRGDDGFSYPTDRDIKFIYISRVKRITVSRALMASPLESWSDDA